MKKSLLLICILGVLCAFVVSQAVYAGSWPDFSNPGGGSWYTGYYRPVSINNTAGAQTDYQVAITPFTDSNFINNSGLVGSWHFSEGSGTTTADMSGNRNNATLNVGGTLVDNCDATAGWTASAAGSVSLNNSLYREGAGAVNCIKTGLTTTQVFFYKTIAVTNMQNKWLNVWVYINNQATLNKIGLMEVFALKSDYSWYIYKSPILPASLQVGWNLLSLDTANPSGTFGTPDLTQVNQIRLDVDTNTIDKTYAAGDIIMDYWFLSNTQPTFPAWTDGKFGKALSFDGVDDYLEIPSSSSLNNLITATWETWVYPTLSVRGDGHQQKIIWRNGPSASNASIQMYWAGDTFTVGAYVNAWNTASKGGYNINQWYHVIGTLDGSNIKLYINGVNVATTPCGSLGTGSTVWRLATWDSTGYDFKGIIDEVRIYNRALTSAEISTRYNYYTTKLKGDYSDIRFTASTATGSAELSYWQETDNKFWVKVPNLPANNSYIYMYYGNPSATSVSNINTAFIFGDDFSVGGLNPAWATYQNGGGTITVTNGAAVLDCNSFAGCVRLEKAGLAAPYIIDAIAKIEYPYGAHRFRFCSQNAGFDIGIFDSNNIYFNAWTGVVVANTAYVRLKQIHQSNRVDWQIFNLDGSQVYNNNYVPGGAPSGIYYYLGDDPNGGCKVTLDTVFVRKYASPEPTVAAPGAESYGSSKRVETANWASLCPAGKAIVMGQSIAQVSFTASVTGTNIARWKKFRIDKNITGVATPVPDNKIEIQIWMENNNNGFWDTGDTFISKGNFTNGICYLNMKQWQVTTTTKTYYIVYKLAGDIGGGQRAGVKIVDSSYLEFENATCVGVP
ncbi:MAG: DUF2341 domain-containing protein [Planctomycetes bacterium]|nr:DUF2341 domain-containing protein [Planctomycetota bacterium]